MYKKGDIVKVYSLQSFHGGGFLNGVEGIVSQDQGNGKSVLVTVKRKIDGKYKLDPSYEVYAEQLEYVRKVFLIEEFDALLQKVYVNNNTTQDIDELKEDILAYLKDYQNTSGDELEIDFDDSNLEKV